MRELLYLIWKEMERTRKVKSPEIIRGLARSPEESCDWGAKSEVIIIPPPISSSVVANASLIILTNPRHQHHHQFSDCKCEAKLLIIMSGTHSTAQSPTKAKTF